MWTGSEVGGVRSVQSKGVNQGRLEWAGFDQFKENGRAV